MALNRDYDRDSPWCRACKHTAICVVGGARAVGVALLDRAEHMRLGHETLGEYTRRAHPPDTPCGARKSEMNAHYHFGGG